MITPIPRLSRKIRVNPGELSSRYYRVNIRFDGRPLEDQGFAPDNVKSYMLEDPVRIIQGNPTIQYKPVGECIYCGARGTRLTDEHIVSKGLGGSLILPEASCISCAGKTSAIEGAVLRNLLWSPRRNVGIRGRRRKGPKLSPSVTAIVDGKEITISLPAADDPAWLFLMTMQAPGLLSGQPHDSSGLSGLWLTPLGGTEAVQAMGIREMVTPPFDTLRFCQFLAKIAHSFAMATLPRVHIAPLLLPLILKATTRKTVYFPCYQLVGGFPQTFSNSDSLHEIALRGVIANGILYAVVHIRLFANLGAPVYTVVAGRIESGRIQLSPVSM
jgi:hypothetical protein